MSTERKSPPEILNKRAKFEYQFLDTYEAGIALVGTEIKSLRKGRADLSDAYCTFQAGELFIRSLFIAEYDYGNQFNHDPRRLRKLLLKKQELRKLEKKVKERGYTIVPYRIFINDRGFAKVEIALAQGKKIHDKRDSIKEREQKRELDRVKKIKL